MSRIKWKPEASDKATVEINLEHVKILTHGLLFEPYESMQSLSFLQPDSQLFNHRAVVSGHNALGRNLPKFVISAKRNSEGTANHRIQNGEQLVHTSD